VLLEKAAGPGGLGGAVFKHRLHLHRHAQAPAPLLDDDFGDEPTLTLEDVTMRSLFLITFTVAGLLMPRAAKAQERPGKDLAQFLDQVEERAASHPDFVNQVTELLKTAGEGAGSRGASVPDRPLVKLPPIATPDVDGPSDSAPAPTAIRDDVKALRDSVAALRKEIRKLKEEMSQKTRVGGNTKSGGTLEASRCTLVVQNRQPYPVELDLAYTDILHVPRMKRVMIPAGRTHNVVLHTAENEEVIAIRLPQSPSEKPRLYRLKGPEHKLVVPIYAARKNTWDKISGTTVVQSPMFRVE
ncbi:MAG: hypothetical protein R6U98_23300, partial [Pirellulaceae bacterium]